MIVTVSSFSCLCFLGKYIYVLAPKLGFFFFFQFKREKVFPHNDDSICFLWLFCHFSLSGILLIAFRLILDCTCPFPRMSGFHQVMTINSGCISFQILLNGIRSRSPMSFLVYPIVLEITILSELRLQVVSPKGTEMAFTPENPASHSSQFVVFNYWSCLFIQSSRSFPRICICSCSLHHLQECRSTAYGTTQVPIWALQSQPQKTL